MRTSILPAVALIVAVILGIAGLFFGQSTWADEAPAEEVASEVESGPALGVQSLAPAGEKAAEPDPAPASEDEGAADAVSPDTSDSPAVSTPEATPDDSAASGSPQAALAPLTPDQAALRDRLRRVVAAYSQQPLSLREITAGQMLDLCLAFGIRLQVREASNAGQPINAVGGLCWNYPCAGYVPLTASGGQVIPRTGYGLQQYPSQLLAVLAQARLRPEYPVRVGPLEATVESLIQYEQQTCRSGANSPMKLVALAYYLRDEKPWKNDLNEEWSLERLTKEELDRSINPATSESIHHLIALSFACARAKLAGHAAQDPFRHAEQYVGKYQDHALKLQNSNGSWNDHFFAYRGEGRNAAAVLRSSGHILEWLACSLADDRLAEPSPLKAVDYVIGALSSRTSRNLSSLPPRDFESVMHALHALALYDARFFAPRTPASPPADTSKSAKSSSSAAGSRG